MNYGVLVWSGLRRKPTRSVLTMLSIFTAFLLYGGMFGVMAGFDSVYNQMSDRTLHIQNRGNALSGLPIAHESKIEAIPGIRTVAHFESLPAFYKERKNKLLAFAVDFEDYLTAYFRMQIPDEQRDAMLQSRTGAVVGADLAERWGWKIGERVTLQSLGVMGDGGSSDWTFDIVGVYTGDIGKDVYFLMHYDYLDEKRLANKGRVRGFIADIDDSARADSISQRIDDLFVNSGSETKTLSERELFRVQGDQFGNVPFFVTAIMGAVMFTLLFVTANAMKYSFSERVREIAILKVYGYTELTIMSVLVAESFLLCVTAAVIGLAVAAGVFPRVYESMGLAGYPIPPAVMGWGILIASLLAVASALLPVLKAKRLNVVDGLAAF